MSTIFIDRFSAGLDDLTTRQQADPAIVLATLKRLGRYSCFEASDNRTIAKTMDLLADRALLQNTIGGYPWTTCKVTEIGEQFLLDGLLPPPPDPFEGMVRISKTVYVSTSIATARGLQEYKPGHPKPRTPSTASKSEQSCNQMPHTPVIDTKGPKCLPAPCQSPKLSPSFPSSRRPRPSRPPL